jgi:flagellar hook-length control protein FliK
MPTTLEVYEKIKTKLDTDTAKTLIEYIQETVEKGSATKEDLLKTEADLSKQVSDVEARLDKRIADVEVRLDKRMTDVEVGMNARITQEIHRLESRLYIVAAVLLGFILLSNPEGFQKSLKFLAGLFG